MTWTVVVTIATQILWFGWLAPPLTRYVVVFVGMVLAQAGFLVVMFRRRLYRMTISSPSEYRSWLAAVLWAAACVIVELAVAAALRNLAGQTFG